MSKITSTQLNMIITDPNGAQQLIKSADAFGQFMYSRDLSTNQIRALFGEVRQIQAHWDMEKNDPTNAVTAKRRLILLKPKMAYRARRDRNNRGPVKDLIDVLNPAIDIVIEAKEDEQRAHFDRFVEFFEAILAYHKAYGGK